MQDICVLPPSCDIVYHPVLVPGGSTHGGGLTVLHSNTLAIKIYQLHDNFKPSTFELQIVKISSESSTLAVLNIYCPPSGSIEGFAAFLDELTDIISTILSTCSSKILLWWPKLSKLGWQSCRQWIIVAAHISWWRANGLLTAKFDYTNTWICRTRCSCIQCFWHFYRCLCHCCRSHIWS